MLRHRNMSQQGIATHVFKEMCLLTLGFGIVGLLIIAYAISTPVFLLRFLISKLAKVVRPDLSAIVSPQGNLFSAELFSPKTPRSSLVIPIVFQGHYTEADFQKRILLMVNTKDKDTGKDLYKEYKQYVENWLGFTFWKNDPHFDIRKHVKRHDFGKRDDDFVAVQELSDVVEGLLNKRFQPYKSPWEIRIVNNYDDPDLPSGIKTVMIMRLHHTLADGYSILYSLISGVVQSSMATVVLPTPVYAKLDIWDGLWYTLSFPVRLMHDVGEYFIKGARKSPFSIPDSKKSWHQIYGTTKSIPIQKIKEIKDGLGVTFTSVLLAAVSSSVAAIAPSKGEVNDRASFFIPLPLPRHPDALTNHVTGAQIDLPLNHFPNRILRVHDLDRQVAEQKSSTIPWLLHFLATTFGHHFSFVCGLLTTNRVNIGGLTSFPMGLNNIRLDPNDGEILSVQLAAGGLGGISGFAFMAISCGKNIFFTGTAESAVLTKEDVDGLLNGIREEIEILHKMIPYASKEYVASDD